MNRRASALAVLLLVAGASGAAAQAPAALRAACPDTPVLTRLADLDGDRLLDLLIERADGRFAWHRRLPSGELAPAILFAAPLRTAAWALADLAPGGGLEIVWLDADGVRLQSFASGPLPLVDLARIPLLLPPAQEGPAPFWGWGISAAPDSRARLSVPGLDHDLLIGLDAEGRPRPAEELPVPGTDQVRRDRRGLVTHLRRRPRIGFAPLVPDGPEVPLFQDARGLHVLEPGIAAGPRVSRLLVPFASAAADADVLEERSISLSDVDGDGWMDALLARTSVRPGALPRLKTELLLFRRIAGGPERPAHVILLPGVLSRAPSVVDLTGDGLPDLLVAVYGGDLRSEIVRRLSGKVELEYLLYAGQPEGAPFSRSPVTTLTDNLPRELFENWDLRHRIFVVGDWDADGRQALGRVEQGEDGLRVSLLRAADPARSGFRATPLANLRGEVRGYGGCRLEDGRPGIEILAEDGVTILPAPR